MKDYIIVFIACLVIVQVYVGEFILARYRAARQGTARPSFARLLAFIVFVGLFYLFFYFDKILGGPSSPKWAEAKTNLGAIYVAQTAYFSSNNTYADQGYPNGRYRNCFELINWEPAGQNRYAYFCGRSLIRPRLPGVPEEVLDGSKWPLPVRPISSRNSFIAVAIGNIDEDSDLDAWMISDNKQLVNLLNDQIAPYPDDSFRGLLKLWLKTHPILLTFYISGVFWMVFLGLLFRDARKRKSASKSPG